MRTRWGPAGGEARSEGFALNRGDSTSGGPGLSDAAFGHTGFPGTSVWSDPASGGVDILLTNRIHPEVRPVDIGEFRRGFHSAAAAVRGR